MKKSLVAFLYGELDKNEKERLEAHLESCPDCGEELKRIQEVCRIADTRKGDIEESLASIDWSGLSVRIANSVFKKDDSRLRDSWKEKISRVLLNPRLRPVYAGLFIGIVLGSFATFLIFGPKNLRIAREGEIVVSQEVLEKVELEMARRQAVDYLAESQYLLLDFVQSPPEESAEFWKSDFAARRAKDLLSRKKYMNPQLDKFQMVKAKAICDQIELLFFELIHLSDQLSLEELKKIQNLIQERQVLLKIKLVKKELEKSEV